MRNSNTCEEIYVRKIESGIRLIEHGKAPKDAQVGIWLNKLKPLNQGLYDDLLGKYKEILENIKKN